jgi:hypothetical protein
MTTTPKTRRCDCDECLALQAAEDNPGCGETVAAFEHDGSTYEIDYLGIGSGSQWGEFAVYCDGEEVAEFAIAGPVRRPGSRPAGLPVSADELVRLARQALSGRTGRDDPPGGPAPGTPASAPPNAAPGPAPRPPPATPPSPARSTPGARQPGNQHGQPQLIAGFGVSVRTVSGTALKRPVC